VEASEEDNAAAKPPSILIVGTFRVELFEDSLGTHRALCENEHIDIFIVGEIVHEAGNVTLIQVPEEKLRHRLVSSVEFPVSSRMQGWEYHIPVITDGTYLITTAG
jgi:hypothetical protein